MGLSKTDTPRHQGHPFNKGGACKLSWSPIQVGSLRLTRCCSNNGLDNVNVFDFVFVNISSFRYVAVNADKMHFDTKDVFDLEARNAYELGNEDDCVFGMTDEVESGRAIGWNRRRE